MAKKKQKKTTKTTTSKKKVKTMRKNTKPTVNLQREERVIQSDFLKPYLTSVLVLAVLNLIGTIMLPFVKIDFTSNFFTFIGVITFLEIILLLWSLGLIIYISLRGVNRKLSNFPLFYSLVYLGLAVWGYFVFKKGIDLFDFTYFENQLGFAISIIFYAAQIMYSYKYLFKNRIKTKNTRKLKKKRYLKR